MTLWALKGFMYGALWAIDGCIWTPSRLSRVGPYRALMAMKRPAARLERNGAGTNWVLEFQTLEQVEVAMCLLRSRVASAQEYSTKIAIQAFEPVHGEPGILVKWKSSVVLTSVKSFVYDWLQKEMGYRPGVRPAAVLPPAAPPAAVLPPAVAPPIAMLPPAALPLKGKAYHLRACKPWRNSSRFRPVTGRPPSHRRL